MMRILIVEDAQDMNLLIAKTLKKSGYSVDRCFNGEEALDFLLGARYGAMILDVMMPKISGFDVLDILRNTPETTNIRVIMLTALSQPKDKERAEQLGVDDYLVKSQVVIGDVVERVRYHLGMAA